MVQQETRQDNQSQGTCCVPAHYLYSQLLVLLTHFLIPFFLFSENGDHLEQIRIAVVINLKGDVNDN